MCPSAWNAFTRWRAGRLSPRRWHVFAFALCSAVWLVPGTSSGAPGGRIGSSSRTSGGSYHGSGRSYHSSGSSYRPSSASHGAHARHAAPSGVRCAHGDDCSEDWYVSMGLGSLLLFGGGLGFVYYRARKRVPMSLVSLLVAVGPAGESIKTDLAQLAERARLKRPGGLQRLAQRACTLLGEYRETFTHAGALDGESVADAAAFAQLISGVWARDRERAEYPGVPTYTVVALLFAVREAPPPLRGSTRADVAEHLRRLAQLTPHEFELMWLPSADRCMTLQELFDRYPELSPLSGGARALSA